MDGISGISLSPPGRNFEYGFLFNKSCQYGIDVGLQTTFETGNRLFGQFCQQIGFCFILAGQGSKQLVSKIRCFILMPEAFFRTAGSSGPSVKDAGR
jgi:hypothetical protein